MQCNGSNHILKLNGLLKEPGGHPRSGGIGHLGFPHHLNQQTHVVALAGSAPQLFLLLLLTQRNGDVDVEHCKSAGTRCTHCRGTLLGRVCSKGLCCPGRARELAREPTPRSSSLAGGGGDGREALQGSETTAVFKPLTLKTFRSQCRSSCDTQIEHSTRVLRR